MTRCDLDADLRQLAGRQRGVLSRRQATTLGVDRWSLERRLATASWELVTKRVVRLVGSPETFEQRCLVGVLDAGHEAVVRGTTAARLWELPGFDDADISVTRLRRRPRRSVDGMSVSEPVAIPRHHRTRHRGVPVTTVERTVFDLAGCVHAGRAERALDNALSRKLTALTAVHAVALELCRKGRPGSALVRRLLADRGVDFRPVESGLEARFLALLLAAGLPPPARQVDLGGTGWVGRVDLYYRDLRLVIEVDSERHHSVLLDVAADERRDAALRAAGFEVVRIPEADIRSDPSLAVERVRQARTRRSAA